MSENQDARSSIRVGSEAESDAPGNESEPDDTQVDEPTSTGTKKRNREADNSVEQKGKNPKKQISGNEASTSRQQPKQKKTKEDGNKLKNTNCKIDRRKTTDKMTDMEVLLRKNLEAFPVSLQIPASFNQIRNEWPMRPDLQEIFKSMQDIKSGSNIAVTLDDVNRDLDALGKSRKELERELDAVLDTDMATWTLTEECSKYLSWILRQDQIQVQDQDQDQVQVQVQDQVQAQYQDRDQVQDQDQDQDQVQVQVQDQVQVQVQVQDQDQVQESLSTLEGRESWSWRNCLEDNICLSTNAEIRLLVCDLEKLVYDENNNKVSAKDFEGLEEALRKTTALAPLPDSLKPIAAQIKEARGGMEVDECAHMLIEVFVCTAIKEMICLQPVNLYTLRKWGATLNYARQHGFQVSFADELLKKNLKSYIVDNYISG
ncbi:hypothetical protein J1N35_024202 [Gossypium stocksii]|uniref:Uncharacterized protein n=1 Tax=Gossypium stocksii TaxID=47602 RepID=A0A9D4A2S6_9ROSI|nr:hypothetical protein J1N35_024202 [Gossypium stocksii]